MTSRLSYASSPESDLELATDNRPSGLQDLGLPGSDRHMVKASSDPSIATQEEMSGPPGYNQLPGYSTARSRQVRINFLLLNVLLLCFKFFTYKRLIIIIVYIVLISVSLNEKFSYIIN